METWKLKAYSDDRVKGYLTGYMFVRVMREGQEI